MKNKLLILHTGNEKDFMEGVELIENSGFKIDEFFTPAPINQLQKSRSHRKTIIPAIGLIFGGLGAFGGFYLQYWVNLVAYPLNFGGKPLLAIPSFIPVIFECALLGSAVAMTFVFFAKRKKSNPVLIDKLLSKDEFVAVLERNSQLDEYLDVWEKEESFKLNVIVSDD